MTSRTFNDAFGDSIRHLKFQMRKVLETRNSNQATRRSSPEGRGWLGTRLMILYRAHAAAIPTYGVW